MFFDFFNPEFFVCLYKSANFVSRISESLRSDLLRLRETERKHF